MLLVGVVTALPVALMLNQRLPSALFHAAAVLAVWCLWGRWALVKQVWQENKLLLLGLGVSILAVVINSLGHGEFQDSAFERALRLCLGVLLLMAAFQAVDRKVLQCSLYGAFVAAVAACAYIFYFAYPTFHRPITEIYNAVGYGNLTLLFGVFACYALAEPQAPASRLWRPLAWVALVAAFIGLLMTQTRSGWLAMPVFLLVWAVLYCRRQSAPRYGRLGVGMLAAVLVGGLLLAKAPGLSDRVEHAVIETQECLLENAVSNTSVCVRMQLWHASWRMWQENPWFGVGVNGGFEQSLQTTQLQRGVVSAFTAKHFGEPHNDIFQAMAVGGVFGLAALLCMYFVPAAIFCRRLFRAQGRSAQVYAAMGIALCVGFFIFGWTELMFRGIRTLSFYAVMMALLMVLSQETKGKTPAS